MAAIIASSAVTSAARPSPATGFLHLAQAVLRLWRARRAMVHIRSMTDHELADIGLSRDTLTSVADLAWYQDPTARLARLRAHCRGTDANRA